MKTIIPAAELAIRILGVQKKRENVNYRLLNFCVQCPTEDGILIYNNMTLELLLLSNDEADRLMELDELIYKWFLVPEEQDDRLLSDQLRDIVAHLQKPVEHITSYTIFTTTDCNARCYYCFEQGFARRDMSRDIANRVVRYIVDHSGGEKVNLNWFGGEPLVNQEAIDIICSGLTDAGIVYHSCMISNGYLFDEATVQKAVTSWRLSKVQITLDGTEKVYNRTKAFIHPEGSPFNRVMNNIGLLLDAGILVFIRLNVSMENWQDLLRLANQLSERFGDRTGFSVYPTPLYDQIESENGELQWGRTRNASLIEKYEEVRSRLTQLGLQRRRRLKQSLRVTHCMADNDGAVTVLPDGSLGLCEHFAESELFGHIDREERDEAMIASWKEKIPEIPACADCVFYPRCLILKKCPGGGTCTIDNREDSEKRLCDQLLDQYNIYKKQQISEEKIDFMPDNC